MHCAAAADLTDEFKVYPVGRTLQGEIVIVEFRSGGPGQFNRFSGFFPCEIQQFHGQDDIAVGTGSIGSSPIFAARASDLKPWGKGASIGLKIIQCVRSCECDIIVLGILDHIPPYLYNPVKNEGGCARKYQILFDLSQSIRLNGNSARDQCTSVNDQYTAWLNDDFPASRYHQVIADLYGGTVFNHDLAAPGPGEIDILSEPEIAVATDGEGDIPLDVEIFAIAHDVVRASIARTHYIQIVGVQQAGYRRIRIPGGRIVKARKVLTICTSCTR